MDKEMDKKIEDFMSFYSGTLHDKPVVVILKGFVYYCTGEGDKCERLLNPR